MRLRTTCLSARPSHVNRLVEQKLVVVQLDLGMKAKLVEHIIENMQLAEMEQFFRADFGKDFKLAINCCGRYSKNQ